MIQPSTEMKLGIKVAREAGQILLKYFQESAQGTIKTTDAGEEGFVTEADLAAERHITAAIRAQFPEHAILAEEEHHEHGNSNSLWVIDPLDGTNNFAMGVPHFAVSIGFYQNGTASWGVVFDPSRNQMFTTAAGQGSWKNETPVRVNQHTSFLETMVATGFYYDRGEMMNRTLDCMRRLFEKQVIGIRRFGTAALDLIGVGCGHYGGYFELTLSPWDFAAAKLFVEEAGGRVTQADGQPLSLTRSSVLASNRDLHQPLLEVLEGSLH